MANEFTASPKRDLPEFPVNMRDAHGNTHTCNDLNAYDAFIQAGMTLAVAPKKATTKKKATKKASK
ncbi:MAG: hypothetical protein ACYTFZ_04035 [Planctomycetota bacterium]|jgi:hypothetical protein